MNPKEYAQALYEVLESKSADEQNEILENLKKVLIKNKDTHLAAAIEKELGKIQDGRSREMFTYIASASALSDLQKKELESLFAKPCEFSQNPSLLGGIAVRQKDRVFNATLRKKIESIR